MGKVAEFMMPEFYQDNSITGRNKRKLEEMIAKYSPNASVKEVIEKENKDVK